LAEKAIFDFCGIFVYNIPMTFNGKNLSFHPRLAAGLDLVLGLVFLWWLGQIGEWWMLMLWAALRLGLWVLLVRLAYFSGKINRWSHFLSLAVFGLGALLLLMFIEWVGAWYAVAFCFVVFPALSFWFLPAKEVEFSFEFKPYRRWRFLLSIFGLMGIGSGLLATAAFQLFYNINNAVWWVALALASTALALWWWHEYGVAWNRMMAIWLGAFFVLMFELVGILMLRPIGFLASGLILIWWWYILWLLIRFHLSPGGIIWKKQQWFLAVNAVAMILFLLLGVRWK